MDQSAAVTVDLPDQPLDCCLGRQGTLLACALVDGSLSLFEQSKADGRWQSTLKHTVKAKDDSSCRAVCLSSDDLAAYAGYSTGSVCVVDITTGKVTRRNTQAHSSGVTRLLAVSDTVLASGDEAGCIRMWDLRGRSVISTYQEHTDFVSDLSTAVAHKCLLAVSGDGTMSVHDLNKRKCIARTEDDADDELLSVVTVKNGQKVVAGSQAGVLSLYSWGYFKDCSDRFPGHPESIDAVIKYDEDTIITGSSDGLVRILSILPNKLLGVVGDHNEFPIERLSLSADRALLASASHDNSVKLWDLAYLREEGSGDEEGEPADAGGNAETSHAADELQAAGDQALEEEKDGTDSEGEEASETKSKKKQKRKGKTKMRAGSGKQQRNSFFSGLTY